MNKFVGNLMAELETGREGMNAVNELAWLLEMNTRILCGVLNEAQTETYKAFLDIELWSVRLTIDEQKEIAEYLADFLLQNKENEVCSSVIWVMGKILPEAGLPALIMAIKQGGAGFDDEMSYQSLISLENFLIYFAERNECEKPVTPPELTDFVEKKANSENERLSELARRVMIKIKALCL